MVEQAKQDLELLRKARNEVQKLEEIHARIVKEEQEIREYEEEKREGVWYEQRPTNKAEEMQKEFDGDNSFRRFKKMQKMVKCSRIVLTIFWVISVIVVNFILPKDFFSTMPYCIFFWMGNFVAFAGLWYIPELFSC